MVYTIPGRLAGFKGQMNLTSAPNLKAVMIWHPKLWLEGAGLHGFFGQCNQGAALTGARGHGET
jgi:hypothetical protein